MKYQGIAQLRLPLVRLFLAIGAAALIAGCAAPASTAGTEPQRPEQPTAEEPADPNAGRLSAVEFPPNAEWVNTSAPLEMEGLLGRYVLLDFWTYGCVNCYHMVPNLNELQQRYRDDLVVIGVHSAKFSYERESENIREAVARYDIRYPVINDSEMVLWQAYQVPGWPTILLFDREGYVLGGHVGEWPLEMMTGFMGNMLARDITNAAGTTSSTPTIAPAVLAQLEQAAQPAISPTLLRFPEGLFFDQSANRLYVADSGNHRILAVNAANGEVVGVYGAGGAGFRDGSAIAAQFRRPRGVTRLGNTLYVADTGNHALRAIDLATGTVSTVNRGSVVTDAGLRSPWSLATDGEVIIISNAGEHQIWRYDPRTNDIGVLAGTTHEGVVDGPLMESEFAQPSGLFWTSGRLFVADPESSAIREITFAAGSSPGAREPVGTVTTLIGTGLFDFGDVDGPVAEAQLMHAAGVAYLDGTLYIADSYNDKLKTLRDGMVRTVALPGLREPTALTASRDTLWIADTNNHRILRFDPRSGAASALDLRLSGPTAQRVTVSARAAVAADELEVSIALPAGFKLAPDSPNAVVLRAPNRDEYSVRINSSGNTNETVRIPLRTLAQRGLLDDASTRQSVEVELWLYYCEVQDETICRFDRGSYTVALELVGDPVGPARLAHQVRLP